LDCRSDFNPTTPFPTSVSQGPSHRTIFDRCLDSDPTTLFPLHFYVVSVAQRNCKHLSVIVLPTLRSQSTEQKHTNTNRKSTASLKYLYGPLHVQPTTRRICCLSNMEVPAVHQLPDVAPVEFQVVVQPSRDSQCNSHPRGSRAIVSASKVRYLTVLTINRPISINRPLSGYPSTSDPNSSMVVTYARQS